MNIPVALSPALNYSSKESSNIVDILSGRLGTRNSSNLLFPKLNLEVVIATIEKLQNIILHSFGYLNCSRNFTEDPRTVS